MMHTIFAQATARGKAGVAIIRISGPDAVSVGCAIAGNLPDAGNSALRLLRDQSGMILDQALVLFFEGPASFTGEDVVELQLHGSVAITKAVEAAILATGLARMAEAGEFTQRALLNDRLDLAQVEGLGNLIEAETEAQRQQAFAVFSGAVSEKTERWRADLLRAAALLEASIDFVDEDVPVDVVPEVKALFHRVDFELGEEITGSHVAERLRDGFEVAILGAPNAGKSTLINALAGRDIAITSEVAGTTRDVIEARLDVDGLPVTFLDTAGLRATEDRIERVGVERAIERALGADLRILLETPDWVPPSALTDRIDIAFRAKADLFGGEGVSGATGQGIDDLLAFVGGALADRMSSIRTIVSDRQREGLGRARADLILAMDLLNRDAELEIVAEHARLAMRSLDSMIGRVDVEDVLGEIFSRFCIGK